MKMRAALLCLPLLVALAACEETFLIQFAPDSPGVWLTQSEVNQLAVSNVGFIDKTMHVHDRALLPSSPPVPPALPTRPQQNQTVLNYTQSIAQSQLRNHVTALSSFPTRFYNSEYAEKAVDYVFNVLNEMKRGRADIEVQYYDNPWRQRSVIARFVGAVRPDQIVVLGSHTDSIASTIRNAPGADDDAAGVATCLETFRVLVENDFRPNRTVEVHFYSAEEVGLKGSGLIARDYFRAGKDVVSMVQFDMVFYPGVKYEPTVTLNTDFTDDDLNRFLRGCVEAYCTIPWRNVLCGYGCSDHASWTEYGYRSAFPIEAPPDDENPFIHTALDTVDKLDFAHGVQFVRLAIGYVVETAATEYY